MYTHDLRRQRVAFAIADRGFAISSPLFLPQLLLRLQFDQVEANHVGLCAQPADDRNRFAHGEAAGNGRAGCDCERRIENVYIERDVQLAPLFTGLGDGHQIVYEGSQAVGVPGGEFMFELPLRNEFEYSAGGNELNLFIIQRVHLRLQFVRDGPFFGSVPMFVRATSTC